jgi:hypothetical protein
VKTDATADVVADAKVDVDVAADIKPRIGGTIVAAGSHNVEVLAFVDGRVEAVVMDAKGELVADPGAFGLSIALAAEGDAKAQVDLAWDVELARFVGEVKGDLVLVPGPIEVSLTADGKASVGALAELGLAARASHGGQIMVAGAWSIELVAKGAAVHAYAFDVSGKAHAAGDLDLDVDLDADTKLDLKWDPPSASYKAEIDGKLDLDAKPLVVRVAADGKIALAAVASFHASAKADADAALAAAADIRPPKIDVKAKAGGAAKAGGSAKASAKVETKKSAKAKGKIETGDGSFKAGVKGSAKAGIKIGS